MNDIQELERTFGAYNYHPLPVVLVKGQGCEVWDNNGQRYLDMMSAYSAVSHGHCHPRLVAALTRQAGQLSVVSRAFYTDQLGPFLQTITRLTGLDKALPMNTGAEAVETGLKAARKWAYEVKGIADDQAEIIVCRGNFHGRTIAAIAMSSEQQYRRHFGPFPPGFRLIDYGDAAALRDAISDRTAAFLVEPIQGEGGIIVPPRGYLADCAEICSRNNVLLMCDEIQTGLGRTGRFLASEHDAIRPDGLMLGKALGGGLYPVSAFAARREILDLFEPGDHGSTFGGNPLGMAVANEALAIIEDENLVSVAAERGEYLRAALSDINSRAIREIRGRGLLLGIELDPAMLSARSVCENLMTKGILTKETHETVVRIAPPLIISEQQIDWAVDQIAASLQELEQTN